MIASVLKTQATASAMMLMPIKMFAVTGSPDVNCSLTLKWELFETPFKAKELENVCRYVYRNRSNFSLRLCKYALQRDCRPSLSTDLWQCLSKANPAWAQALFHCL